MSNELKSIILEPRILSYDKCLKILSKLKELRIEAGITVGGVVAGPFESAHQRTDAIRIAEDNDATILSPEDQTVLEGLTTLNLQQKKSQMRLKNLIHYVHILENQE